MAQLTIYLDESSLKAIKQKAKKERTSVSRWTRKRLIESLDLDWDEDYFDVLGALSESDLRRPEQPRTPGDVRREKI